MEEAQPGARAPYQPPRPSFVGPGEEQDRAAAYSMPGPQYPYLSYHNRSDIVRIGSIRETTQESGKKTAQTRFFILSLLFVFDSQ